MATDNTTESVQEETSEETSEEVEPAAEHSFTGRFRQVTDLERVPTYAARATANPGDYIFEFEDGEPAFIVPHQQYARLTGEPEAPKVLRTSATQELINTMAEIQNMATEQSETAAEAAAPESPSPSTPEGEEGGGSYDGMTVTELQDELRDRDLPTSGSKAELVARLEEDDEA